MSHYIAVIFRSHAVHNYYYYGYVLENIGSILGKHVNYGPRDQFLMIGYTYFDELPERISDYNTVTTTNINNITLFPIVSSLVLI